MATILLANELVKVYDEETIHLDFGAAYNQLKLDEGYIDDTDFPEPYRYLEQWFLTTKTSKIQQRTALDLDGTFHKDHILMGYLQPMIPNDPNVPPIFIRITTMDRWSIDRSISLRGIWVHSSGPHPAWYWLRTPCSLRPTINIRCRHHNIPQHDTTATATLPSMATHHRLMRALFGLVSNISDIFSESAQDISTESLYLSVHVKRNPSDLHQLLSSPNDEYYKKHSPHQQYPKVPFDLDLLLLYPAFCRTHLIQFHAQVTPKCLFIKGLDLLIKTQTLQHRPHPTWTSKQLLASAKGSEERSQRNSWGLRIPHAKEVRPNWKLEADLAVMQKRLLLEQIGEEGNDDDDDDDEALLLFHNDPVYSNDGEADILEEPKGRVKPRQGLKYPKTNLKASPNQETHHPQMELFDDTDSDDPVEIVPNPNEPQNAKSMKLVNGDSSDDEPIIVDPPTPNSKRILQGRHGKKSDPEATWISNQKDRILKQRSEIVFDDDSDDESMEASVDRKSMKRKRPYDEQGHHREALQLLNGATARSSQTPITKDGKNCSRNMRLRKTVPRGFSCDDDDDDEVKVETKKFTKAVGTTRNSLHTTKKAARAKLKGSLYDSDDGDTFANSEEDAPAQDQFQYSEERMKKALLSMNDAIQPPPSQETIWAWEHIKSVQYIFSDLHSAVGVFTRMVESENHSWEWKLLIALLSVNSCIIKQDTISKKFFNHTKFPAKILSEDWRKQAIEIVKLSPHRKNSNAELFLIVTMEYILHCEVISAPKLYDAMTSTRGIDWDQGVTETSAVARSTGRANFVAACTRAQNRVRDIKSGRAAEQKRIATEEEKVHLEQKRKAREVELKLKIAQKEELDKSRRERLEKMRVAGAAKHGISFPYSEAVEHPSHDTASRRLGTSTWRQSRFQGLNESDHSGRETKESCVWNNSAAAAGSATTPSPRTLWNAPATKSTFMANSQAGLLSNTRIGGDTMVTTIGFGASRHVNDNVAANQSTGDRAQSGRGSSASKNDAENNAPVSHTGSHATPRVAPSGWGNPKSMIDADNKAPVPHTGSHATPRVAPSGWGHSKSKNDADSKVPGSHTGSYAAPLAATAGWGNPKSMIDADNMMPVPHTDSHAAPRVTPSGWGHSKSKNDSDSKESVPLTGSTTAPRVAPSGWGHSQSKNDADNKAPVPHTGSHVAPRVATAGWGHSKSMNAVDNKAPVPLTGSHVTPRVAHSGWGHSKPMNAADNKAPVPLTGSHATPRVAPSGWGHSKPMNAADNKAPVPLTGSDATPPVATSGWGHSKPKNDADHKAPGSHTGSDAAPRVATSGWGHSKSVIDAGHNAPASLTGGHATPRVAPSGWGKSKAKNDADNKAPVPHTGSDAAPLASSSGWGHSKSKNDADNKASVPLAGSHTAPRVAPSGWGHSKPKNGADNKASGPLTSSHATSLASSSGWGHSKPKNDADNNSSGSHTSCHAAPLAAHSGWGNSKAKNDADHKAPGSHTGSDATPRVVPSGWGNSKSKNDADYKAPVTLTCSHATPRVAPSGWGHSKSKNDADHKAPVPHTGSDAAPLASSSGWGHSKPKNEADHKASVPLAGSHTAPRVAPSGWGNSKSKNDADNKAPVTLTCSHATPRVAPSGWGKSKAKNDADHKAPVPHTGSDAAPLASSSGWGHSKPKNEADHKASVPLAGSHTAPRVAPSGWGNSKSKNDADNKAPVPHTGSHAAPRVAPTGWGHPKPKNGADNKAPGSHTGSHAAPLAAPSGWGHLKSKNDADNKSSVPLTGSTTMPCVDHSGRGYPRPRLLSGGVGELSLLPSSNTFTRTSLTESTRGNDRSDTFQSVTGNSVAQANEYALGERSYYTTKPHSNDHRSERRLSEREDFRDSQRSSSRNDERHVRNYEQITNSKNLEYDQRYVDECRYFRHSDDDRGRRQSQRSSNSRSRDRYDDDPRISHQQSRVDPFAAVNHENLGTEPFQSMNRQNTTIPMMGRGRDRNLPAWKTDQSEDPIFVAPLVKPMGMGRGIERTRPSWMTNGSTTTTDVASSIPPPSPKEAFPSGLVGGGRGAHKTLPAWMTKGT